MSRSILHVDMDAFFAAVEVLDCPELRGKPVVVGGGSHRGVVAAASYEARKFGVHSAMPMAEARRKCPQAVVVPPRRERYEEISAHVFSIFHRYTPLVEGLSLDEAFLDVTGSLALFGDAPSIARRIKDEIHAELGLTASAGVAACKFVAKIASDMDKPDGLTVVPDDVAAFLAPLPMERMWGIGAKTSPVLRAVGIRTIGDLAEADPGLLQRTLGSWGAQVRDLARGIDDRAVIPESPAKSIGAESTYEKDLTTAEAIERSLLAHSCRVAERLTGSGLAAGCVVAKLKYADFTVVSRQITLPEPVKDALSLHAAAVDAFRRCWNGAPVRLTGVSARALVQGGAPQASLFVDPQKVRREKLEQVAASLRTRFQDAALTPASLLEQAAGSPADVVVPEKQRV